MSLMAVPHILERIRGATRQSPIAVFIPEQRPLEPALDAVFANTVITQRIIEEGSSRLIGVYDRSMDLGSIHDRLHDFAFQACVSYHGGSAVPPSEG